MLEMLPMPEVYAEESETIFRNDELEIKKVDLQWGKEDLLKQKGLFFAKDVVKLLGIKMKQINQTAKGYGSDWQICYAHTGIRKVWTHWYINMTIFAGYYIRVIEPEQINHIPKGTTKKELSDLRGWFSLTSVAKALGVQPQRLRYLAKKKNKKKRFKKHKSTWLVKVGKVNEFFS